MSVSLIETVALSGGNFVKISSRFNGYCKKDYKKGKVNVVNTECYRKWIRIM